MLISVPLRSKVRGREARERRKLCPTHIFRGEAGEWSLWVANVSCVVKDEMAVELVPAQNWDLLACYP